MNRLSVRWAGRSLQVLVSESSPTACARHDDNRRRFAAVTARPPGETTRKMSTGRTAPGTSRELGQAESTAAADKAAKRLYEIYRERKGKVPFDRMHPIEIQYDCLETEMFNYQVWLSSTAIPKNFDNNLQPPKQKGKTNEDDEAPIKIIQASTLAKYVGKTILSIRRKFPEHPDFANLKENEVPDWWTRSRPKFEKECIDFHWRIAGSEFTFGETKIQPLYSDNNYAGYDGPPELLDRDRPINDYISKIDLQYILRNLFADATLNVNKDGKLQHRAILALCFHCVGRGGEVKFVDTAEWTWHPRYEVLDIKWTELKTRTKHAMPLVPNKDHFLSDPFHCLASFWLVEFGLYRHGEEQLAIQSYCFPDLHGIKDSGIAKKITTLMRKNLPEGCPKEIKDSYSSKSLRQGSITELATHPQTNTLDVCNLSGHATGTHALDTYADELFIVRGLRGAKALAHFCDIDADIKVPRLECLGTHTASSVDLLLEKCFVCTVSAFLAGGSLHKVLRTGLASLIMYHQQVTKEFTPANAVATKMRDAAREAGISDFRFPGVAPECVLDEWSKIIETDFHERNPEISPAKPDMVSMAAAINQLTEKVVELTGAVKSSNQQKVMDQQRISHLEDELFNVKGQNIVMQEQLARAEGKLSLLKTPEGFPRTRTRLEFTDNVEESVQSNKSPRTETSASPAQGAMAGAAINTNTTAITNFAAAGIEPRTETTSAVIQGRATAAATESSATAATEPTAAERTAAAAVAMAPRTATATIAMTQPHTTTVVTTQRQRTTQSRMQLLFGAQAKQTATEIGKGVTISMLLTDLFKSGHLKYSKWTTITPPTKYKEKWALKNTLELCDQVVTEEEKAALKRTDLSHTDLMTHVKDIEKRAFRKMWELEGKDVDVEQQVQDHTNKSQQLEATYLAIGKRVKQHKKALAEHTGAQDYNKEKLHPLPKKAPPGTPEDTHSVRGFFSRDGDGDNNNNTESRNDASGKP